jgi:hypothetical protein
MGWSKTEEDFIYSPELPAYPSGSTLEFYHFYLNEANTFQVGFSTTTNDATAFNWSSPIAATVSYQNGAYTVKYSQTLPDGVKYVAFKATASSQNKSIFIDNFKIYKGAANNEWEETVSNVNARTLAITGLTPETEYEWQVQGNMTNGTTEWSKRASFTTMDVIIWNNPDDWTVPETYADVTIPANTLVIIPSGYTAYADEITIEEGGQITIEDGGQLLHSNEIPVVFQMNVDGYQATRDENPDNDGYRLIASPVYESSTNLSIAIPEAMIEVEENYDLYMFDQTQELEWINHKVKVNDQPQFTTLDLGKGYLYANTANVFVAFVGQTTPTNFPIGLDMVYEPGHVFTGWNLLGNPYTATAYADRAYYVLDAEGDEVISAELGEGIAPMKGFFVEAGSAEDLTCTVSTTPQNDNTGSLNINLSQANTLADRAIVNFGEGKTLGKFQLNPNHTKVFIPQEGKDYAVVSAGDKGEMPVSFKAEKSGTYTMSLSSQNVSFSYLHLIDNKTGQDIDMLATPAYTFNAQTTDYASRFRLVFATDNSVNSDSFGFVNNSGNFCVYGIEGEATLQVFDVLGHMLSSETFSGSIEKKVNAATGIYMMRLINGNDVKVQKVIIK